MDDRVIFEARALVLADLQARGLATPEAVSALDEACSQRRWWVEQWPEGATYVAGLVAQDVQDALADSGGPARAVWPVCHACDHGPRHVLRIEPDLGGPDPTWVCEETGAIVAGLGRLD